MNLYQSMNNWASGFIFAAVLAGLYRLIGDNHVNMIFFTNNADSIFLVLFIVFFRVKMHLDDHKYFKYFESEKSKYKYFGFLAAIAVWFFMALAAGTIKDMETATVMLAVAFALSTAWIAIHLMEIALTTESKSALRAVMALRHKWIIINMSYIVLLVLYSLGADVLFTVDGHHIDVTKWAFIFLMIVIMILDHYVSDPHSD